MKTATQIHKEIETKAQSSLKKMEVICSIKINEHVRQGDIYVRRIKNITGSVKIQSRQLAPGNTKGSRHIVADSISVNLFDGYSGNNIPDFMKGPQIEAKEKFVITHPEHAHIELPPGNYQVTYQMDFKRKERVVD